MTQDLLSALVLFAFATSITPGPNNIMLMTSGANYGIRRTVPHALGVGGGFITMIVLVGLGLAEVLSRSPRINIVLVGLSVAYTLWLAYRIATASPPGERGEATGRPMTFLEAALFQWVNPKAAAMALTAVTIYAPDQTVWGIAWVALVFGLVNLPCISLWTCLGVWMRGWLAQGRRYRVFNVTMAVLLILSLVPLLPL